jgi:transcriptional regulator with XRE-family HTH domain
MYSSRMSPLAIRILELRTKKGLSQVQLAKLAKVSQPTISLLERGETRSLNLDIFERIANALDVEPGDLIVRFGIVRAPKPSARRHR